MEPAMSIVSGQTLVELSVSFTVLTPFKVKGLRLDGFALNSSSGSGSFYYLPLNWNYGVVAGFQSSADPYVWGFDSPPITDISTTSPNYPGGLPNQVIAVVYPGSPDFMFDRILTQGEQVNLYGQIRLSAAAPAINQCQIGITMYFEEITPTVPGGAFDMRRS